MLLHLLALVTPLDPLHNDGYQFWSGIGSDIFLLTGITIALKHFNCHVKGCWRHGHIVHGTSYRACSKHHPRRPSDRKITAETIADASRRRLAAR